ncbi:unnamed protein product [Cuscuta epithymum]|uniref:DUF674 domain-containing protein n=1 Tax=Cuscuta epithymum TaxID=186058 RepID=A0AAV0D512_9ASTE|nr:unnamed protein product [Cuscuta epithymum]
MAAAAPALSLKLLIDKKAQKVVFAEAQKPFVDVLFYLMSLPLGTVINLVTEKSMVGALGKLYGSIVDLSETYLQPGTNKETFLSPKVQTPFPSEMPPLPLPAAADPVGNKQVYVCPRYDSHNYNTGYRCRTAARYSNDAAACCPDCKSYMNALMSYVPAVTAPAAAEASSSKGEGGGYVRGVATYMVMDDLKVMPQSTISTITALNEQNIKDFGSLEVKVVNLGVDAGLKLLKASLQTESVLTTVFLGK